MSSLIRPASPANRARGLKAHRSDLYDIGNRIRREVDENLSLELNLEKRRYEVWYDNPQYSRSYLALCLPLRNEDGSSPLDGGLIEQLKSYDSQGRNAFGWKDYIREQERAEQAQQREVDELWDECNAEFEARMAIEFPGISDKTRPVFFNSAKQKGSK